MAAKLIFNMKLARLLIAEPVASLGQHLAEGCERLADETKIITCGEEVLACARALLPEMVILSLELEQENAEKLVSDLREVLPSACIVVTFRELSLGVMERLRKLGANDFVAQPVDLKAFYRAASEHFGRPFRRYDRHELPLDVKRADGVLIGRTIDISEGGMRMSATHPLTAGDSLLVDIELDDSTSVRVRSYVLEVLGNPPLPVSARLEFQILRGQEHEQLLAFLNHLARGP